MAERDRLLKELDQNRSFETYAGYLAYRKNMADLAALVPVSLDIWPVTPEETGQANPIENEGVWNPVSVIRQVKIPVSGNLWRQGPPGTRSPCRLPTPTGKP